MPVSNTDDASKVQLPSTAVNTLPGIPETPETPETTETPETPETPEKDLEDVEDSNSAIIVAPDTPEKEIIPENVVRTTLKLEGNFANF